MGFSEIGRNAWVVLCFLAFVGSIFCFAILYYRLYLRRAGLFLFSSEIEVTQHSLHLKKLDGRIKVLARSVESLEIINLKLAEGISLDELVSPISAEPPVGLGYRVVRGAVVGFTGSYAITYGIDVYNDSGRLESYIALPNPVWWKRGSWLDRTDAALLRLKIEFERLQQLRLATTDQPFHVWSFWDFLYFSAITQSTVGYGDILPNSTVVRMIVVLQVLVGYADLIVLLNLALRQG